MPEAPPPLRRPQAWERAQSFGRWSLVLGIALLTAGIAIGILAITQDRTDQAPLYAIAGGGGIAAWGLVAIGLSFPTRAKPPLLVNAVAVTPSSEKLADDWVHLFRRRRMARAYSIGLVALGLYMLTIGGGTVYLVAIGVEDAGILLFAALPIFSGVMMLGFGAREAISRQRLSTFGRAPTGFTLGTSGFTLLEPHTTRFIPWERIASIRAGNARTRGGESPLYPTVTLTLHPDAAGGRGEEITLQMLQYLVHRAVVVTALVEGLEDAAFRGDLGTMRAQAVLDRWAAVAR
jgi:hypothetical protein